YNSLDLVSLNRDCGGLGVCRVREFKSSLSGKWSWRLLGEHEGLWFKVLAAKCGVEEGMWDFGTEEKDVSVVEGCV
ncbi:putative non-LTR retroelement reverse transcriptase, partial [Trifolium medium]|nr:putative non-LTR retroelement reverse transcriptase [Trifolium medium]